MRTQGSSPLVRGALVPVRHFHAAHGIIPARAGSTCLQALQRPESQDHPRSCGEHVWGPVVRVCDKGSSPLVRGARSHQQLRCSEKGIIPARAGSTECRWQRAARLWDHPRSCGEHPRCPPCGRLPSGSSPLVRGALSTALSSVSRPGIIPARAGSTECRWQRAARLWDHPRSCGEHLEKGSADYWARGSSPLVRGAPHTLSVCRLESRIIPARAGSTDTMSKRDYPKWGSSPLVRGALGNALVDTLEAGIIPARAGSTTDAHGACLMLRDHPRSCGEHGHACARRPRRTGSSPLVRGAPYYLLNGNGPEGIIPARAGSTGLPSSRPHAEGDHPRSCGEHRALPRMRPLPAGSSPLVRGALWYERPDSLKRRIIPARAGSTGPYTSRLTVTWDHPRSCGEHWPVYIKTDGDVGSSPLVRGAHHPQPRGRHESRGSSPLVRGALMLTRCERGTLGIIPARAGSTRCRRALPLRAGDHPRSCGEHRLFLVGRAGNGGSSPLVRGAPAALTWC